MHGRGEGEERTHHYDFWALGVDTLVPRAGPKGMQKMK
jgi:hypothetical protein